MQRLRIYLPRVKAFIRRDIWRISFTGMPRLRSSSLKLLKAALLTIQEFRKDKCQLRASALTFYTLLSIVPVVAMAFGIAKGFGYEKLLEQELYGKLPGQEEVLTQIITFARSLLENTKGGLIAGIGIIVLFWSVIKILDHTTRSLNDIWGVEENRSFGRKFSDYLSMVLIAPFLFILSSSVTVLITTEVTDITRRVDLLGYISPFIFLGLKIIPYCLTWVLFAMIYVFMPSARVSYSAGFLAGIIAGTIFQLVQWGYIHFQVGVARYNAIYGSFAALPLFLLWIQLSWLIILFGAEISHAIQSVDKYGYEADHLKLSMAHKKLLALQVSHILIKNFLAGQNPLTVRQISDNLQLSLRLVRQIMAELVEGGIFSATQPAGYKESAYIPARDVNAITIQSIIEALEQKGIEDVSAAKTEELELFSQALQTFRDEIKTSTANRLLKEL